MTLKATLTLLPSTATVLYNVRKLCHAKIASWCSACDETPTLHRLGDHHCSARQFTGNPLAAALHAGSQH
jgi:hypothetical protein